MAELNKKGLLHTDCLTVTGKTVGENIKDAVNKDPQAIRPIDNPLQPDGRTAVLKGNLAPDKRVVKRSAVVEEMLVHVGPAEYLTAKRPQSKRSKAAKRGGRRGSYPLCGPSERRSGHAGDAESHFCHRRHGTGSSVALITDGRFSGSLQRRIHRPCIAGSGSGRPDRTLVEGDMIKIDIPNLKLELDISEEEMAKRKQAWQPRKAEGNHRISGRYASMVTSGRGGLS